MPASKPVTRNWTIPASGKNTIAEIMNNPNYVWVTYFSVRAARNNSGDIYVSDPDGQAGAYIGPGEALLLGNDWGSAELKDFTLSGTASDSLYITVGVSLGHPPLA